MNTISVVAFALCIAFSTSQKVVPKPPASTGTAAQPGYTTRYDNINLDEILNSPRLVKAYVSCLETNKGCTPEGTELRKIIPDALATSCSKCSTQQRDGAIKVITRMQKDYPNEWKRLSAKWDPTGEYFKKLSALATPAKTA